MRIKTVIATLSLLLSIPAYAQEHHHAEHTVADQSSVPSSEKPEPEAVHAHGAQTFHAFILESEIGKGNEGTVGHWDLDGWIGGDYNKLWVKSEGKMTDGATEQLELWALYSRYIAEFWDFQAGVRHDTQPESTSYLVLGFGGLAPYFFETEAHLFLSDEGDVSVRLRQENEFLLTQRLILEPYFEANLFAQDVPEQDVGAGLADAELGLQTRYEITRKFAPYVDVHYERKFGETSSIAKDHGENNDDFVASVGLRLMF